MLPVAPPGVNPGLNSGHSPAGSVLRTIGHAPALAAAASGFPGADVPPHALGTSPVQNDNRPAPGGPGGIIEKAGEGIRTLDIHLGKVALYH